MIVFCDIKLISQLINLIILFDKTIDLRCFRQWKIILCTVLLSILGIKPKF